MGYLSDLLMDYLMEKMDEIGGGRQEKKRKNYGRGHGIFKCTLCCLLTIIYIYIYSFTSSLFIFQN